MTQFRTSKKGVDLIKLFEGFRDRPERLESGDWLIGYGQVRSGAEPSRINRSEATNQLRWEDLPKTEAMVASLVMVPLNQNEFDALVSFAFNLGEDRFKASDVLKLLNAGQKLQAASALDQWTQATLHGEVQTADALIRRRAAEKALFLMPDGQPGTVTSALYPPSRMGDVSSPAQISTPPLAARVEEQPVPKSRAQTREDVQKQLTRILGPNGAKVSGPKHDASPAPSSAMIAEAVSNMARATEHAGSKVRIDDFETPEITQQEALAAVEANRRLVQQPLTLFSPETMRRGGLALVGFLIAVFGVGWAIQNEFSGAASSGGVEVYMPSGLYILGGLICIAVVAGLFQDTARRPALRSSRGIE